MLGILRDVTKSYKFNAAQIPVPIDKSTCESLSVCHVGKYEDVRFFPTVVSILAFPQRIVFALL